MYKRQATRGLGSAGKGKSLDKYSFAVLLLGGFGASVRAVNARDNLVQGGVIAASFALQDVKVGDSFFVVIIP